MLIWSLSEVFGGNALGGSFPNVARRNVPLKAIILIKDFVIIKAIFSLIDTIIIIQQKRIQL